MVPNPGCKLESSQEVLKMAVPSLSDYVLVGLDWASLRTFVYIKVYIYFQVIPM